MLVKQQHLSDDRVVYPVSKYFVPEIVTIGRMIKLVKIVNFIEHRTFFTIQLLMLI